MDIFPDENSEHFEIFLLKGHWKWSQSKGIRIPAENELKLFDCPFKRLCFIVYFHFEVVHSNNFFKKLPLRSHRVLLHSLWLAEQKVSQRSWIMDGALWISELKFRSKWLRGPEHFPEYFRRNHQQLRLPTFLKALGRFDEKYLLYQFRENHWNLLQSLKGGNQDKKQHFGNL